jgi:hypothetical protein
LENLPDGCDWRYFAPPQGERNRAGTAGKPRSKHHGPLLGTAFVHTVLDDHSRVAYAEIHDDETAATAIGVLRRAVAWFADRGVTVERVLSDNGSAYRSHAWRAACAELGIKPKRTRPYRPQTNGKIERFHRTLADGWAFTRMFLTESARRKALPAWLHEYNHHRPHTAIGNRPPITRLTNLGLPRLQLTRRVGWSGRGSGEVECLVFDRCESSEVALPAPAVVGPFDPAACFASAARAARRSRSGFRRRGHPTRPAGPGRPRGRRSSASAAGRTQRYQSRGRLGRWRPRPCGRRR